MFLKSSDLLTLIILNQFNNTAFLILSLIQELCFFFRKEDSLFGVYLGSLDLHSDQADKVLNLTDLLTQGIFLVNFGLEPGTELVIGAFDLGEYLTLGFDHLCDLPLHSNTFIQQVFCLFHLWLSLIPAVFPLRIIYSSKLVIQL